MGVLQKLIAALAAIASLQTVSCATADYTIENGGKQILQKSDVTELVTLVKVAADKKSIAPIGRSYNNGDWENVAGPYQNLIFKCFDKTTYCKINLPNITGSDEIYQVKSYNHALPKKDELARFLEQATFGATRQSIGEILNISDTESLTTDETMAKWTYDQMYNTPMSSHRAYFRKRALHRFEPNHVARPMHACEKLTRYRRSSISIRDWKKWVNVKQESNRISLYIGGYIRTVVDTLDWADKNHISRHGNLDTNDKSYFICTYPGDGVNQTLAFQDPTSRGCITIKWNGQFGTPPVQFFSDGVKPSKVMDLPEDKLQVINQKYYTAGIDQELLLKRKLDDKLCPDISAEFDEVPVFGLRESTGEYFIHDPPPKLLTNTMRNPARDGGSSSVSYTGSITKCANVERNFINEKYCKLSTDITACGRSAQSALDITLNHESLEKIYNTTKNFTKIETRYVYAINNLRIDSESNTVSPCTKGGKSRWIPSPDNDSSCTNTLQTTTKNYLKNLLRRSSDTKNAFMRDVLNEVGGCHANDIDAKDFLLDVNGKCWKHVHQDHLQVFDFTYWTYRDTHPGNSNRRNPIKEFAEDGDGLFFLDYPGWHGMDRWVVNRGFVTEVGRYGDKLSYSEFPPLLRTEEIAKAFGGESFSMDGAGVLVCGSPFEVANDPRLEGTERKGAFDVINYMNRTTNGYYYYTQKQVIWTVLALHAKDQLRQRVAWALSQILTLAQPFVQTSMNTEQHVMFYDIFVRHAFGNYRDILKEVSQSPIMAENLSFMDGRSTFFQWDKFKNVAYADENFAREVMQLFSVGLCKLNIDGSQVKNKDGSCVQMYDNDDVSEYARAWTGYRRQAERGGTEAAYWANFHDPLKTEVMWRDSFPKMGLGGQYIGDKLPLCADRVKKHFLKKGAKYILLGASSVPHKHTDPIEWSYDKGATKMVLSQPTQKWNATKYLYTHLCNPTWDGKCRPKAVVHLKRSLKCSGMECDVDTVRVVQVTPDLYYEYVAEPCVYQAYLTHKTKTNSRWSQHEVFCADPRIDSFASPACCSSQSDSNSVAYLNQLYYGERTSFETAVARCEKANLPVCNFPSVNHPQCRDGRTQCNHHGQYWSKGHCAMFAKINKEGKIAIVHDDQAGHTKESAEVNENSLVYFRVHWKKGIFPVPDTCTANSYCTIYNDMCLCEVEVIEYPTFVEMPTREDVLSKLHIGAYNPEFYKYEKCSEQDGVILHCRKSWKNHFKKNAIFEVIDNFGRKVFLKNMRSTAMIRGDSKYRFRNPVHINNLLIMNNDRRDAEHETDATIDHYFYNDNTAPFVAHKLIQRFGVSNPSPKFIKDVATAFKTGSYIWNDKTFGTGEYGDLAATMAALLLHKETRSVVLDKDASHGALREPLVRLMNFMRASEIVHDDDKPFPEFMHLQDRIGQMVYEMRSVFGFYLADYVPAGRVSQSSLVSPEAQLNSGPYMVGLMNGLFCMVKYGLSYWWDGFFWSRGGNPRRDPGFYGFSVGYLGYNPTSGTSGADVVDELSTLLTSGRLSAESRKIIADVYDKESNKLAAKMMAQQLITSTPEFHTTGLVQRSGEARPAFVEPVPSTKPYKAVVFLFLDGGIDSFNVLVPKCEPLRSQYNAKRLSFALPNGQLLPITLASDSPSQPCNDFGVHYRLADLKRSFDAGETLFFANAGVLNAPVTRKDYGAVTKTQLFAHNTMKAESQRLDPYAKVASTGVLGRMMDELQNLDYKVNAIAIDDSPVVLKGRVGESPPLITAKQEGSLTFDPYPWSMRRTWSKVDLFPHIQELNNVTTIDSSVYGETWASDFLRVIDENALLDKAIKTATLSTHFPNDLLGYAKKLAQVARLIKTKDIRGVDRDAFFVEFIRWDTHLKQTEEINPLLTYLNNALTAFWKEIKAQGNFENVVMVSISDFARTLTPNSSDGTDHAWGGHYFMTGGKVKGTRILGRYPDDLDGPLNVDGANDGRGRYIPTMAYEAIWNGVSQWMGVDDEAALDRIMPNRQTCGSSYMFNKEDLFDD